MLYRRELTWAIAVVALILLASQATRFPQQPGFGGSRQVLAQASPRETVTIPAEAMPSDSAPASAGDEQAGTTGSARSADDTWTAKVVYPLFTLVLGIAIVLGLIVGLKMNAFVALITAAMVISLMSGGDIGTKIQRVADEFGAAAGGIGIVIGMAAIIGKCMLDSGAADRIVRAFVRVLGETLSPLALMLSGFVLAIPVFFDTVFYLLVPLARSLHRRTSKQYLTYILAIAAGGAITHTLVPPTPGPLLMAGNLGIDIGVMMLVGLLVAFPSALVGLACSVVADRLMKTPMRSLSNQPEPKPLPDDQLPSLLMSLAPVVLPVVLISTSTILNAWADAEQPAAVRLADVKDWSAWQQVLRQQAQQPDNNPGKLLLAHPQMAGVASQLTADRPLTDEEQEQVVQAIVRLQADKRFYKEDAFSRVSLNPVAKNMVGDPTRMNLAQTQRRNRALLESAYPQLIERHQWQTNRRWYADISNVFGNANLALLISTAIAMWTLVRQRNLTRNELAAAVEAALMSGGVIILITAGGGAFGKMLGVANVGDAVENLFGSALQGGSSGVAFLLLGFLVACVLKIAQGSSTVAMIVGSGMLAAIVGDRNLGFNVVYLATAIGGGSLVGSWMNDSGFWIFAKMGGLTEIEALKSWTIVLTILGLVSLLFTVLFAQLIPLL
jgi:H+/gluconate symporter-like permease